MKSAAQPKAKWANNFCDDLNNYSEKLNEWETKEQF